MGGGGRRGVVAQRRKHFLGRGTPEVATGVPRKSTAVAVSPAYRTKAQPTAASSGTRAHL